MYKGKKYNTRTGNIFLMTEKEFNEYLAQLDILKKSGEKPKAASDKLDNISDEEFTEEYANVIRQS